MDRRTYLALCGTALTSALAGCGTSSSDPGDRQQGTTDDASSDDASGSTDDETGSTDDGGDAGGEPEQRLELLDHEWYHESEFEAGVRGTAKNVSDESIDYAEVQVYFLDSEGRQIGDWLDNTNDLAAGREWAFDVSVFGDAEPSEVDSYEIETSADVF